MNERPLGIPDPSDLTPDLLQKLEALIGSDQEIIEAQKAQKHELLPDKYETTEIGTQIWQALQAQWQRFLFHYTNQGLFTEGWQWHDKDVPFSDIRKSREFAQVVFPKCFEKTVRGIKDNPVVVASCVGRDDFRFPAIKAAFLNGDTNVGIANPQIRISPYRGALMKAFPLRALSAPELDFYTYSVHLSAGKIDPEVTLVTHPLVPEMLRPGQTGISIVCRYFGNLPTDPSGKPPLLYTVS